MKIPPFKAIIVTTSMLMTANYTWAGTSQSRYVVAQAKATIGKAEAAEIAKKKHGGKVLKVDKVNQDGQSFYRVRLLLDDGRVKTIDVDARQGTVS